MTGLSRSAEGEPLRLGALFGGIRLIIRCNKTVRTSRLMDTQPSDHFARRRGHGLAAPFRLQGLGETARGGRQPRLGVGGPGGLQVFSHLAGVALGQDSASPRSDERLTDQLGLRAPQTHGPFSLRYESNRVLGGATVGKIKKASTRWVKAFQRCHCRTAHADQTVTAVRTVSKNRCVIRVVTNNLRSRAFSLLSSSWGSSVGVYIDTASLFICCDHNRFWLRPGSGEEAGVATQQD